MVHTVAPVLPARALLGRHVTGERRALAALTNQTRSCDANTTGVAPMSRAWKVARNMDMQCV
jgi:hypothetical protein